MANKGNVTVGKPLVAGAVYRAPVGVPLPTSAEEPLLEQFYPVGYISDQGLRWSYSGDGDVIRAWGRDVVARPAGVVDDVASFQMLETVDEEAVKAFWGDDARQIISGGYALQVGVPSPVQYSWVIDMFNGPGMPQSAEYGWSGIKRIVIPAASVRERDEIVYQDRELVAYGLSLRAMKDSAGMYHYEYSTHAKWVKITNIPETATPTINDGYVDLVTVSYEAFLNASVGLTVYKDGQRVSNYAADIPRTSGVKSGNVVIRARVEAAPTLQNGDVLEIRIGATTPPSVAGYVTVVIE